MCKSICLIKFRGQDIIELGSCYDVFKDIKEQLESDRITIRIHLCDGASVVDRHYLRSDFEYFEFRYGNV